MLHKRLTESTVELCDFPPRIKQDWLLFLYHCFAQGSSLLCCGLYQPSVHCSAWDGETAVLLYQNSVSRCVVMQGQSESAEFFSVCVCVCSEIFLSARLSVWGWVFLSLFLLGYFFGIHHWHFGICLWIMSAKPIWPKQSVKQSI